MLPKVFANLIDNSIRHGKIVSAIYLSHQITEEGEEGKRAKFVLSIPKGGYR